MQPERVGMALERIPFIVIGPDGKCNERCMTASIQRCRCSGSPSQVLYVCTIKREFRNRRPIYPGARTVFGGFSARRVIIASSEQAFSGFTAAPTACYNNRASSSGELWVRAPHPTLTLFYSRPVSLLAGPAAVFLFPFAGNYRPGWNNKWGKSCDGILLSFGM